MRPINQPNVPQTADTQQQKPAWQIQKSFWTTMQTTYNKMTSQVAPMASVSERSAVRLPDPVAK